MTPQIKYATLSTGVTVEYIEAGAFGGEPLLLLHGLSDSWHSFLPLLPHLPRDSRALALSQRGHGRSSKPRSDYDIEHLVADAVAFLDLMHVDRAVVVGHSMGAAVAAMLAARHPRRVAALALLGAFGDFAGNPAVIALREDLQDITGPIDPEFARAFQLSTVARMIDDDFIDLVVNDSRALPSLAWRGLVDALMTTDLSAVFGRIEASTVLVWGDADLFVPRDDQEAMLSRIPRARLQILPGTGHAVHWERPGETAALLTTLMREVAQRNAA